MNLFSVVEGLREENLSTAILRHLLLRSEDIRERFIRLVSDSCRRGPVTIGDQFACLAEHRTTDDALRPGRLDLVVETTNTVVGVENKLFAEFRPGQPEKYLQTLAEHARKLGDLRGTGFEHVLVILAPESRRAGIDAKIRTCQQPDRYISLTWEDAIRKITETASAVDPTTAIILAEFRRFLFDEKLAFMPQFERLVPHLKRSFEPRGTSWQREVVGRLWRFFRDGGARMDSGPTWVGYYFCTGSKERAVAWYGFLPRSEIREDARHEAELVVATSFSVAFTSPAFRRITLANPNFLGKNIAANAWAIEYEGNWEDANKWQDELRPLSEASDALPLEPQVSHV